MHEKISVTCFFRLAYLPADVVDVSLVQELEHQLVMNLSEHPNEWAHAQQNQTQDSISNRIELVVDKLLTETSSWVGNLGRHGKIRRCDKQTEIFVIRASIRNSK